MKTAEEIQDRITKLEGEIQRLAEEIASSRAKDDYISTRETHYRQLDLMGAGFYMRALQWVLKEKS